MSRRQKSKVLHYSLLVLIILQCAYCWFTYTVQINEFSLCCTDWKDKNNLRIHHSLCVCVCVFMFSYGEPEWLDVVNCQGIQNHHCDLSRVTSDPREWYYAKVHASSLPSSKSAWTLSPRFSPRWDSKSSHTHTHCIIFIWCFPKLVQLHKVEHTNTKNCQ